MLWWIAWTSGEAYHPGPSLPLSCIAFMRSATMRLKRTMRTVFSPPSHAHARTDTAVSTTRMQPSTSTRHVDSGDARTWMIWTLDLLDTTQTSLISWSSHRVARRCILSARACLPAARASIVLDTLRSLPTSVCSTATPWHRPLLLGHLHIRIGDLADQRTRATPAARAWAMVILHRTRLTRLTRAASLAQVRTAPDTVPVHPVQPPRPLLDRLSRRLRMLLARLITWTSGEAYVPGPVDRKPYKPHVNDVRYRFHNVQGLNDKRFREYYLRLHQQLDFLI